jgi:hypothetical protein
MFPPAEIDESEANHADRRPDDTGQRQTSVGERSLGQGPAGCDPGQCEHRHVDVRSSEYMHAAIL